MPQSPPSLILTALSGFPLIQPGDDLSVLIAEMLEANEVRLQDADILVLAQKIISKSEGRLIDLSTVNPSALAIEYAKILDKDARFIQTVLGESDEILRVAPNALVVVHKLGFVISNAGVDQSNVDHGDDESGKVLLLPENPDRSAKLLKAELDRMFGVNIGVVINDSTGRPWRRGVTGMALGAAGVPSLRRLAGHRDLFGRPLRFTDHAAADEIASAASLLMGQADEGLPIVHIRGLRYTEAEVPVKDMIRPKHEDVFR